MSNKNNSPEQKEEWARNTGWSYLPHRFVRANSSDGGPKHSASGTTLRRFAPTRQPDGYYSQETPFKHRHAHARRRAIK